MYLLINIEACSVYPTEFHTHPQTTILQIDGVSYREELLRESCVSSICFVHCINANLQNVLSFVVYFTNVIRLACLSEIFEPYELRRNPVYF